MRIVELITVWLLLAVGFALGFAIGYLRGAAAMFDRIERDRFTRELERILDEADE